MINLKLVENINSDEKGYAQLIALNNYCSNKRYQKIILDFGRVTWFSANLCAVLGALINSWQDNLNEIRLVNLSDKLVDIFRKNWFLKAFGSEPIADINSTTIKYKKHKVEDSSINDYVVNDLLKRPNFLELSPGVVKLLAQSIFEVFANARHSGSRFVYSCGQCFPQCAIPKIDFTIVDVGRTIQENVTEYTAQSYSSTEAIEWALKKGHTTKPLKEGIPGGLGLDIIMNFIDLNKGNMQIISSDGMFTYNNGSRNFINLAPEIKFPGTIVNIGFNLSRKEIHYITKSERVDSFKF